MPGRRRLWTYSARPVTFSQDSRRGSERPTCGVSAGLSARFMEGAPEIDANQLFLVGRRAVQVAFDAQLLRCRLVQQVFIELPAHKNSRSEEHTSELQSPCNLVCRLLLEKK